LFADTVGASWEIGSLRSKKSLLVVSVDRARAIFAERASRLHGWTVCRPRGRIQA
jgi:hypothetical protein